MREKTRDAVAETIDSAMQRCFDVLDKLEGSSQDDIFTAVAAVAVDLQRLARLIGVDVSSYITESVKAQA